MFTHILIATDGSELADKAVEQGLALTKKLGAKVTAVTVTLPWVSTASGEWPMVFPIEDYERAAAATAQRILGAVAEKANATRMTCDTVNTLKINTQRKGSSRGEEEEVRSYRYGLARTARHRPARSRQ